MAGEFNGLTGCQIVSGGFFHLKPKCKGGESCVHDTERQWAKALEDFDPRGLFSVQLG